MVSLLSTFDNGVITFDDGSVVIATTLKVIITFLDEANLKKINTPIPETKGVADQKLIAALLLSSEQSRERIKHYEGKFSISEDVSKKKRGDEYIESKIVYGGDVIIGTPSLNEKIEEKPKVSEKKRLKYSDFNFEKSQKILSKVKTSFSDEVIAERRLEL